MAVKLYTQASEMGYHVATAELAAMYRDGRSVDTKTSLCTFALEHWHYLTKVNLIAAHWIEPHVPMSSNWRVPSAIDA